MNPLLLYTFAFSTSTNSNLVPWTNKPKSNLQYWQYRNNKRNRQGRTVCSDLSSVVIRNGFLSQSSEKLPIGFSYYVWMSFIDMESSVEIKKASELGKIHVKSLFFITKVKNNLRNYRIKSQIRDSEKVIDRERERPVTSWSVRWWDRVPPVGCPLDSFCPLSLASSSAEAYPSWSVLQRGS